MRTFFISVLCVAFIIASSVVFPTCRANEQAFRLRRAIPNSRTKAWTDGVIPYQLQNGVLNGDHTALLKKAMKIIEDETCVTFRPYSPARDTTYVDITNANRCFSIVGMGRGRQVLQLAPSCRSYGMILHELCHTVGLSHELGRPDRDKFVDIYLDHIQPGMEGEFRKDATELTREDSKVPFDFQSISLYHPSDFSKNGKPTYVPKATANFSGPYRPVRQKDLSFGDVMAFNRMYQCDKKCSGASVCPAGAFRDKHCRCQTAEDYAKRRCQDEPGKENFCNEIKRLGACYSETSNAAAFCRRTCNLCFQAGNEGKVPSPPLVCRDNDDRLCPSFATNGFCFFDVWTMTNCQKSCRTCPVPEDPFKIDFRCRDRHDPNQCHYWAKDGLCQRDAPFMQSQCARSCLSCQPDEHEPTWYPGPRRYCHNQRTDAYCEARARQMECLSRTDEMKIECPLYCGHCEEPLSVISTPNKNRPIIATTTPKSRVTSTRRPDKTTSTAKRSPPATTDKVTKISTTRKSGASQTCVDLNTSGNCDLWARYGHCRYNYVKKYCRKSCKFC